MTDFWLFIGTVAALLGTPGPTNTLLYAAGALRGWRASLPLLLEELCGYLLAILVIAFTIGPVLAAHPHYGAAAKALLSAYTAFLAWRLWRLSLADIEGDPQVSAGAVFVTTLLNPKAVVFALVVIHFQTGQAMPYLLTFCGFVLAAGCAWLAFGALVGGTRDGRYRFHAVRAGALVLWFFSGLLLATAMR